MNGNGVLEDIRWICGIGGEMLPAASYALLPNLEQSLLLAIGEGLIIFVVCFLHTRGRKFLYQTPGPRPHRITGRFVNTATRGWVGAPNERAPFGNDCGFVDRCRLSRTRNLASSN